MKYILILLTFLFCFIGAHSQEVVAYVENGKPYINYTVPKGEGLNFIASKMAVMPGELIEANGLQLNIALIEGQELRVPIDKVITLTCSGNNCLKVYYVVQPHEGLYRIGKNFGNIKVAQLKQLNTLSTDALAPGQRLLVGYLQANSIDAKQLTESNISKPKPVDTTTAMPKTDSVIQTANTNVLADTSKLPAITSAPPKIPDNKKFKPDTTTLNYSGKGVFEDQFTDGGKSATVTTATFKSESGWNDGKFYVLINDVAAGNIIRINNPISNAILYAKVLGPLPVVKGGDGIKLRINTAGAALLGLRAEEHFEVSISY